MTKETEKQTYEIERYKKKIKDLREAYQVRKDHVREFTLKDVIGGIMRALGAGGEPVETDAAGVSNVDLKGNMPTTDQYKGPDNSPHKLIKGYYQTGIKARLAATDKWNDVILEQAGKAGVNPLFVKLIMAAESGGVHSSTPNFANCVGLMQVQDKTVQGMGLDWNKARNDEAYNIYVGCMIMRAKQDEIPGIIKRAKNPYRSFRDKGYELKNNLHGCAWLYNGFSVPSPGSDKVTTGGVVYADQIASMYAGFGRDAHKDTLYTLDVLEDKKGSETASNDKKSSGSKTSAGSSGALSIRSTSINSTAELEVLAPRQEMTGEEIFILQQRMKKYPVPIGKTGDYFFQAPSYDRRKYMRLRKTSYRYKHKEGFGRLPEREFIHLGGPQENYYAEEALEAFRLLKEKLGYDQLLVTRGFEPDAEKVHSSHSAGIAMDIFVRTPEEAIYVADTAWLTGFRAIAIGPKFVHVDTGPEAVWAYEKMDAYRGPGTTNSRGLSYGFR